MKLFSAAMPAAALTAAALAAVVSVAGAKGPREKKNPMSNPESSTAAATDAEPAELEKATFAGGCFWCTEAVFERLKGVHDVVSGYSGGEVKNPTYEQVCSGQTGHAEAIQISYDPKVIAYDELLEVFWKTHDPTTLNQQGADFGTQYRSAIFYHNEEQKNLAEQYKKQLDAEHAFRKPIVTEITKFSAFYPAEPYHQDYFETHKSQAYCRAVINPKVQKLNKVFHDKLKDPPAKRSR
ncbi:MAG TPA: peptide-methionine (S)-S-oxide reductase MsrA [Pirellulales bacterium]|nr:peptide-methionine (S)-S-oxide reductase MsrA [Pirellulales bacterium]